MKMRGLLVRQVPVRLTNVSLSGFLLESQHDVRVGATGELRVDLEQNAPCSDQVRIARNVDRAGAAARYHLGGEFLWGSRPGLDSVRHAVRTMETKYDAERD